MPRTAVPLQAVLRKGVDAAHLLPRAQHFASCAQISQGIRATHEQRSLLDTCLRAFIAALEGGIETLGHPVSTVTLFRTFRYRIDTTRTNFTLEHRPSQKRIASFDIGSPMRTFAWVEAMDVAVAMGSVDHVTRQWLNDRLTRFARRHLDGIALRRQLFAVLAPCPVALRRARRAAAAQAVRSDCPAEWLNACTENATVLDEIQSLAPGVLPLVSPRHGLLARPLSRNVLQELQKKARFAGVTPADWGRLVKSNPRALWRSLRAGEAVPWIDAEEFLAAWCLVHRGLPPEVQLTRAMWLTVLRPNGEGVADALTLPNYWSASPLFIRSAMAESLAAREDGRHEAFLKDWARVIRWLADFMNRGIGKHPRSFKAALRRAAEDERRAVAEALSSTAEFPFFPLPRWNDGTWTAVDLDSAVAVVEHAIRQAHCGETLVEDCAFGSVRVFAVHNTATGKAVGTVSLDRTDEGWRPSNAKHFANRPPSAALIDFVFRLARTVEKRESRTLKLTPAHRRVFAFRPVR